MKIDNNGGSEICRNIEIKYLIILAVMGGLLFFAGLGSMSLWDTDEALYTQIAREMVITGDYITTQWNFNPWFCHPPLYFWMTTLAARLFGWTEFAARFGSALFGFLFSFLIYYFGKILFNARSGFYGALVSTVILQLWVQSRMALLDMPFLFFMMAGLYCFILGFLKKDNRYYAGFWVLTGLSVLTKGPVGLILPLCYAVFYTAITGEWKRGLPLLYSPGILLFLIITVPWHWSMTQIYGDIFLERTFGYFFVKRIVSPVMNQDGAWHYYIPFFLGGFLPWTAFIPLTFYFLFKNFNDRRSRFLLVWIIFTFVLFTLAGTKRPNYIIFIYPALSLALGWCLDTVFSSRCFKKSSTVTFVFFSVSSLLVIAAFIVAAVHFYPEYYKEYSHNLILLGVPFLAGGIITLILSFKNKESAFYSAAAMAAVSYLIMLSYIPLVESLRPEPAIASVIRQMKKPQDRIAVRGNFGRQFSLVYYIQSPAVMYHSDEELVEGINNEQNLFVVLHKKEYENIKEHILVPVEVIKETEGLILIYKGNDYRHTQ